MTGRRILVTNDDGVQSEGIIALADALRALGEVTVVAPDIDRSGVAHSISIHHPVRVSPVRGRSVPTYTCSGTPADCVVVGAFDLCGGLPDLVVSGINRGANLGDDITYSGTVAAAIEGILVGVKSIAISLAGNWPEDDHYHWASAGRVAREAAELVLGSDLPAQTLLNVNVPNREYERLAGRRLTVQGRKIYSDRLERRTDPRGGSYYWIWGSFDKRQIRERTDLEAVRDGFVSMTPLSIDRTDRAALERLQADEAWHAELSREVRTQ